MPSDQSSAKGEPLCLDQFLKLAGIVGSGGQAKMLIQGGEVLVNGAVETRRRRKLSQGDTVEFNGETFSPDPWLSGG
ncbi:MAG: RNA-binding S4 domain-containing protein [Planctomyces sp.]|jgi:ribosome-associated protein|nr:RNA-binding S4 domain-containing protein [Planctomyces sp.]